MLHQYKLNGYNVVLDTCSGSVHSVDDVAYDIIALYPDHTEEEIISAMMEKYGDRDDVDEDEIRECIGDVRYLEEHQKLYTPDTYEPLAGEFKKRSGDVIKALCLHVSHTCNLNCEYCFASQGKYHGDRALMTFEVAKQAMDFLVAHSGTRRNLEVDFFGGEPLMNWDVVKQTVDYCRSIEKEAGKNFRFTVTTNGMLIDDEVIDYCNKEMSNVVLSLDGRKEVHDRTRVDYAGNGSWERIVPKFKKLVDARGGKNYYMRGTFTHLNTDFTNDIFTMADLGFRELSMEPVVAKPGDPLALTEEDLPVLKEEYELLAKEMLRREETGDGFTFYHYMIDLTSGPCASPGAARGQSTWQSPPGATCTPATSSSGKRNTNSATSGTASPRRTNRTSSGTATPTPVPTAPTAGRNSTAPAAARPTRTTRRETSRASTSTAVNFSASASNAPS